jgi:hypothetical protein
MSELFLKTRLDKANRLQISKRKRLSYKLETKQYPTVTINFSGILSSTRLFKQEKEKTKK